MSETDEAKVYAFVMGKVVSDLRERAGGSQQDLAQAVGVTQTTISRLERGEVQASAYVVRSIALALGMEHFELVKRVDRVYARTRKEEKRAETKQKQDRYFKQALVAGIGGALGFAVMMALKAEPPKDKS